MSTPPGHKDLWKNVTWKNHDEKVAFFNHYFKNFDEVTNQIRNRVGAYKEELLGFIEKDEVMEEGKKRGVTIKDIVERIKEEK